MFCREICPGWTPYTAWLWANQIKAKQSLSKIKQAPDWMVGTNQHPLIGPGKKFSVSSEPGFTEKCGLFFSWKWLLAGEPGGRWSTLPVVPPWRWSQTPCSEICSCLMNENFPLSAEPVELLVDISNVLLAPRPLTWSSFFQLDCLSLKWFVYWYIDKTRTVSESDFLFYERKLSGNS